MIAEIVATGDEVLTGGIVDSNSSYIAEKLTEIGVAVGRHVSVGDNARILTQTIQEISQRADLAIVTGGLGPTEDDLSSEAAAAAAGVDTVLHPEAMRSLETFLNRLKRPVSATNRKQAYLPRGADCIVNPVGTAPGFSMSINQCRFFFLPGVPGEMKHMVTVAVLPEILRRIGERQAACMIRDICVFGPGESDVSEQLSGFTERFPEIKLGLQAVFPEIHVKLYLWGKYPDRLKNMADDAIAWVERRIGDHVFSFSGEGMEAVIGRLLKKRRFTVALAESCTGGLIAHRLTSVSGSSDYFNFSGVTYANAAKIEVLGVSAATLRDCGAVHENTAREMAQGARRAGNADLGLATTGIAGPTGGTKNKPVGTVCIGLAAPEAVKGYTFHYPFTDRGKNKAVFTMKALDLLRRELM
jgi:nicotinamide-nucleotide amidase